MAPTDTPSWSDLPLDLAAQVLRRLPRSPRHLDRVRFSAVCRQWRAAARENLALPRHFPWLALPDRSFYSLPAWAFQPLPLHLKHHRQLPHAQSSCGEWLVFERNDGKLTLMSPFSAATMVLPALHDLHAPDKPFKAVHHMRRPTIRKLVVVSDKLIAATVVDETRLYNVVVKLALCRPGTFWWTLATGAHSIFKILRDIVLYKGQLYAINIYRALYSLSVSATDITDEPVVSRVDRVIGPPVQQHLFKAALTCYLIESGGTLLMIYRRRELQGVVPATKFVVFVANFERSRWNRAQCNTEFLEAVPEDRVLFLGRWCCRSVRILDHQDNRYIDMGGSSIVFFSDDDHGVEDDYHRKRVPFYCSMYNFRKARSQLLLQTSVQPLKGFQTT